jgi:RsiW-degrading membrane proteinase PrsW (M82 family)/RNA polymerase subunit RPABC4/transcription elongation factor Spt4
MSDDVGQTPNTDEPDRDEPDRDTSARDDPPADATARDATAGDTTAGDSPPVVDPTTTSLPVLPTLACHQCGQVVPAGHFCGSCGSHLLHYRPGQAAARRLHAYAAFPDEPMYRLSIVSSLFPHLSHHSRNVFRVASLWLAVILVALAIAGLEAPLIAVAALGLPLLFQLYVIETGPYGDDIVVPTFVTLVVGAGLGVGWAQIAGPYVQHDLLPVLQSSLTTQSSFAAAVLVPAVGQILMCVPVVLLLLRRRTSESLDGFVMGAAGALGFTAAATIAELSSRLSGGILAHQPFLDVLSEAIIRGITVPLVAATATGLFGATIWVQRRRQESATAAKGLWLTSPIGALAVALLVQIGLGYADIARLNQPTLVVIHLAAVLILVAFLRIGLHHVLLHEHHDFAIGPPRTCSNCHHVVPAMPFCPQCGVAQNATSRSHRKHQLEGPEGPEGPDEHTQTIPTGAVS